MQLLRRANKKRHMPLEGVEKVFLYRLFKNAQMQGVRNHEE